MTKIAIIDIDGTIIRTYIQWDFIKFLYKKDQISAFFILKLYVWFVLYKLRIVKDVRSGFSIGLGFARNQSEEKLNNLADLYFENRFSEILFPGSRKFIDGLVVNGYSIVILSAAVDLLSRRVANYFDITEVISTQLNVKDGLYTGGLRGSLVYGDVKLEKIREYFEVNGLELSSAIAYADHESDLPLLKAVGKAYICNPSTHMLSVARREGIDIISLN